VKFVNAMVALRTLCLQDYKKYYREQDLIAAPHYGGGGLSQTPMM